MTDAPEAMTAATTGHERVTFPDGKLDEIVGNGGAHLERMGGKRWFLRISMASGWDACVWFTGKVDMIEYREPTGGSDA